MFDCRTNRTPIERLGSNGFDWFLVRFRSIDYAGSLVNPPGHSIDHLFLTSLQKRALRLIFFCRSREHAIPLFIKSNCLPIYFLFFQQLCYLVYDIHTQVAPINLIIQFTKTRTMHNYHRGPTQAVCLFMFEI